MSLQRGPYRLQLIYRTTAGGNHYNHIHFDVQRTDMRPPPIPVQLIYPAAATALRGTKERRI